MGLDQYATAKRDVYADKSEELHYWRKHPNLQGWMERLWRKRTGGEGDFNCVQLQLTLQDIERLEEDVRNRNLPETTGFFFGQDSDAYYFEQDLEFIEKARDAIIDGKVVYYSSWW